MNRISIIFSTLLLTSVSCFSHSTVISNEIDELTRVFESGLNYEIQEKRREMDQEMDACLWKAAKKLVNLEECEMNRDKKFDEIRKYEEEMSRVFIENIKK